jgi:hypothetical protein
MFGKIKKIEGYNGNAAFGIFQKARVNLIT